MFVELIVCSYNVVCDTRIGYGSIQTPGWTTIYQPGPIATGTASTSATATLKYISGAGQVRTATAVGTLTAFEGQLALSLACVYTSKATAVNVYWFQNGAALVNVC